MERRGGVLELAQRDRPEIVRQGEGGEQVRDGRARAPGGGQPRAELGGGLARDPLDLALHGGGEVAGRRRPVRHAARRPPGRGLRARRAAPGVREPAHRHVAQRREAGEPPRQAGGVRRQIPGDREPAGLEGVRLPGPAGAEEARFDPVRDRRVRRQVGAPRAAGGIQDGDQKKSGDMSAHGRLLDPGALYERHAVFIRITARWCRCRRTGRPEAANNRRPA